jgi:hypothetical protein
MYDGVLMVSDVSLEGRPKICASLSSSKKTGKGDKVGKWNQENGPLYWSGVHEL